MSIDTAITVLSYTGLACVAILVYVAVSFGPYFQGREDGRRKNLREIISLSIDNPAKFQIWLAQEQLKEASRRTHLAQEELASLLPKPKRKLFPFLRSSNPAKETAPEPVNA